MSLQLSSATISLDPVDAARPPTPRSPDAGSASRHTATVHEVRRSTHGALRQLGVSLAQEFAGRVPAGTVIRVVGVSRERLLAAGVRAGLVVAVESMTRARLERYVPESAGLLQLP